MKGAFKFLWRVVASVWMPPVTLVGIVLAIFVEDVLWSKYPALLVRYMLACEWIVSKHLGFILILVSAISAVLFFCDLARKKWRRALARVGLFAVGFATMW